MHDVDVRDALRMYVSNHEPPMGLTSIGVLAAGRRSRRVRTAATFAAVASLGGLLVGGLVVAPGMPWSDIAQPGNEFRPARPCATTPGVMPAGAVSETQPLSEDQAAWASARLTCHLGTVMPDLLPEARYAQVPGWPGGPLTAFSREAAQGGRVDAMALVRDDKGTGDLLVTVGVTSPAAAVSASDECRRSSICTVQKGPNGETVVLNRAEPDPVGGFQDVNAQVFRGHTYVYVEVSNSDRQSADGRAPVATRDQPVLSADQVVALALSPELYLFP